ncbi:MAG: hypothetical protein IPK77_03555 [Cellvibrio sp.]|nr:hypothetical protein [Cellvibrio sp.]
MPIKIIIIALGVAIAMDADILRQPFTPGLASAVLGALSGFFVARMMIYWQAKKASFTL